MPDLEKAQIPEDGGGGSPTLASLLSDNDSSKRASLKLLQRAVRGRWKIQEDWYAELPKVACAIAANATVEPRTRLAALRVLHLMSRDELDAAITLERLHAEGEMVEQLMTLTFKIVEAQRPAKQIASTQHPSDKAARNRFASSRI